MNEKEYLNVKDIQGILNLGKNKTYELIRQDDFPRHTCASLYFRAGVPIKTICRILGNSREVCEKTYIHFCEEQLKNAASQTIKAIDFF